jgi:hypothetical protein
MTQGRSDRERRIAEDKVRSKTGDRLQPAGTNGSEEGRQDRRTKGPVSIEYKFSIRDISNARYGRKEGQCRGSMSTARYGRGKIIPEKSFEKKLPGKILHGAS